MPTLSPRRSRPARTAVLLAALPLAVLPLAAGACGVASGPPKDMISIQQALQDVADALTEVRESSAMLQAQVDSLRDVVARQDTLLRRLGAATGVPMP